MSGICSGLLAQNKNARTYAVYDSCSVHLLNIIGKCVTNYCTWTNIFFLNLIQNIYVLVSDFTHRWNILSTFLKETGNGLNNLKSISTIHFLLLLMQTP